MLSFFPRDVLDEILNLIESVSEGFPSCSISVSNFIKLPSILLEICSRQKCDERTGGQTDKAATICSPFGEHNRKHNGQLL